MANPLANVLGGGTQNMMWPFGNMMQMLNAFNQFKNQLQGDPKQKVQELLNSGQISQEQYNQAQQMARQFQQMLSGMK